MSGSPRKDLRSQASRSRFHEGSMNDRVSAVPPVQFLGPEEREVLERPLEGEYMQHRLYQLPKAQTQTQLHLHMQPLMQVRTQAYPPPPPPQPHHQKSASTSKKGGNLFGQVWEGVREKLKLRRDGNNAPDESSKKKAVAAETKRPETDRPSREETMANYHQLMASGFFSQHAIQSTRHARPKTAQRPSSQRPSSKGSIALSHRLPKQPTYPPPTPPIPTQWSLSVGRRPSAPLEPLTPVTTKTPAPFLTPASNSSRGTKRAAAADEDDIQVHEDSDSDSDDDMPDRSLTPHTKLRRIASRNFVPMPQLPGSRAKLFMARRTSSSGSMRSLPPVIVQQKEPPKKLTKRPQPTTASTSSTSMSSSSGRSSLDILTERMYTTVRRNVSENYYSVRAVGAGSMTARILKPRSSAQGLNNHNKSDASRGVPRVPQVPSKYSAGFGDERENRQLWRAIVG